jgi:hypothetical protein
MKKLLAIKLARVAENIIADEADQYDLWRFSLAVLLLVPAAILLPYVGENNAFTLGIVTGGLASGILLASPAMVLELARQLAKNL